MSQNGYSLLEVTFAVAIFAVLMLLLSGVFTSIYSSQRSAIAGQNLQESMRFAMEVMSKEIRTAHGTDSGSVCDISPGATPAFKVFNTSETVSANSGDELYFENQNGQCVQYRAVNDSGGVTRLLVDRGGNAKYLTPDEIEITNILFYIQDNQGGTDPVLHPRVTIRLELEHRAQRTDYPPMKLQTTISSRYYE